ncbi:MAG: dienelactone hydrolase family protein [Gammaproteobacteria bacterium]|nr:dienelactone hydrolase family protein [Gammaproteobacteria bacterium]MBU1926570.1 dienelactone hydrolase family protein [Gammaproteobacteria bacterium]MBU2546637.1 dienelactone hydrolase family protein [Gammaproteobacteria bacterium]
MTQLECIEINPSANPVASIIWMHGLGADADDFVEVPQELHLPASLPIRFIFPQAPVLPITINNGMRMQAWYDIQTTSFEAQKHWEGLEETEQSIKQLIQQEITRGIKTQRVYLAGFSQGGATALYVGLRHEKTLGGIIALSCHSLFQNALDYEINPNNQNTPIFLAHGGADTLIPLSIAEAMCDDLFSHEYNVEWHLYPEMPHSVCEEEIQDIRSWLITGSPLSRG